MVIRARRHPMLGSRPLTSGHGPSSSTASVQPIFCSAGERPRPAIASLNPQGRLGFRRPTDSDRVLEPADDCRRDPRARAARRHLHYARRCGGGRAYSRMADLAQ